jgi:caffeoyl-CoA O-methyltransferase
VARTRTRFVDADIAEYAGAHSTGPDDVQRALQEATAERTGTAAGMQIGDDQAVLMEMVARAMGARRAIEIGTFTGYSALALARGMGPEGRLICCDVSEEWTAIAREHWERAGVAGRIELRIGPGLDTVRSLPAGEQFDLAFVDADKRGYGDYYQELVPRLRPGGLLLADNTLWGGRVLDPDADDEDTKAIRAFNDRVAGDARVEVVVLPIGDGVTVIQRRDD